MSKEIRPPKPFVDYCVKLRSAVKEQECVIAQAEREIEILQRSAGVLTGYLLSSMGIEGTWKLDAERMVLVRSEDEPTTDKDRDAGCSAGDNLLERIARECGEPAAGVSGTEDHGEPHQRDPQ